MKFFYVFLLIVLLTGCVPEMNFPESVLIYEDVRVTIKEDVTTNGKTYYKDVEVKKGRLNGVESYCGFLYSSNLHDFTCFAFDGEKLIKGYDAADDVWIDLDTPIELKRVPL